MRLGVTEPWFADAKARDRYDRCLCARGNLRDRLQRQTRHFRQAALAMRYPMLASAFVARIEDCEPRFSYTSGRVLAPLEAGVAPKVVVAAKTESFVSQIALFHFGVSDPLFW